VTIIKYKDAANTLQDIKSLHALWMRMRIFLDMSFTDEPLSADTEQNFLQVKSQLSKYLRVMAEKVDKTQFRYDPEKITNLLRQAISVTHLRGLPIPDRKTLYYTQTPQTFTFEVIRDAHEQAMKKNIFSASDDVQMALDAGYRVKMVEGAYTNIKITTPYDYEAAQMIAAKGLYK